MDRVVSLAVVWRRRVARWALAAGPFALLCVAISAVCVATERGSRLAPLLVSLVLPGVAVVCAFAGGRSKSASSWSSGWPLVGFAGSLLAVPVAVGLATSWLHAVRDIVGVLLTPWAIPMVGALVLIADTLRRSLAPPRIVVRMAIGTAVIWVSGMLFAHIGPIFGCGTCCDGPARAQLAVVAVLEGAPVRAWCEWTGASLVVLQILAAWRGNQGRKVAVLLGPLAVLLAGVGTVDVLAAQAAQEIRLEWREPPEIAVIDALATWGQIVAWGLFSSSMAAWTWAGMRSRFVARDGRRYRVMIRGLGPILPALVILLSPRLDPAATVGCHQVPDPFWEDHDGFVPMREPSFGGRGFYYSSARAREVVALLDRQGELHAFQGGRRAHLRRGQIIVPAGDELVIVLDERVTIGDLRQAVPAASGFDRIRLAWLDNNLGLTRPSTREWFPFVARASRGLAGESFQLTVGRAPSRPAVLDRAPRSTPMAVVLAALSTAPSWPPFTLAIDPPPAAAHRVDIARDGVPRALPPTHEPLPRELPMFVTGVSAGPVVFVVLALIRRRPRPRPIGDGPYRQAQTRSRARP